MKTQFTSRIEKLRYERGYGLGRLQALAEDYGEPQDRAFIEKQIASVLSKAPNGTARQEYEDGVNDGFEGRGA